MADPVDQHGVLARLVHARAAQLDVFGNNAGIATIHLFDEGRGKAPLAADDQSDFLDAHESSGR